ncbi:hypothetical protein ES705_34834 [subsurface metagenome]
MKILLITLFLSILFWCFSIPYIIRTYARTLADDIICGRRPATEKRLSRCISILTWSNKWITNRKELDSQRIIRLRDMLKEMQKPHG